MLANVIDKCSENFKIAEYTTLKIGGCAEYAYFPSNHDEIITVRNHLLEKQMKITIIGAGSNLLVSSQGIKGGVIFTNNLKELEIGDDGRVKVGCGVKSAYLAKVLLDKSLTGLEFLIGIPGSIGGAVTMNSSAHGQAIEDVIESVEVLNIHTGEISVFQKSELNLGYRYSFVESNKHLILNTTFNLKNGDADKISELMDFHVQYRAKNHPPLTEPSAGSTFRNPAQGIFIGQLIEKLGGKGWVEGGARISDKHANFIINYDKATSVDVSRLMNRMYTGIKNEFGYEPIAEIRFVGEPTQEEEEIWKSFVVH